MHCAPSNEIVASIWDDEPRRDSRKRIAPGFSCGPFTLHRPTCFHVSGPPYSLLPAELVSVAAENGHGEKCRSMSRTSGSRLCKKGHAQTNRWSAMRFEERYSRTSAGLCILCRKAIIPALVGCKVRPDPMMDKLAAERCEGKSLPECACFRRLPQPRVCKRTESGFSRACSVAECPAIVIGSPKRRRPLIRPLMKQPQAGF